MALLLQIGVRSVEVTDERAIRHNFEGTLVKGAGTRHRFLMFIHRAAFCGEQVVPAILLVQVGTFGDLHRSAIPDGAGRFWLELHGVDVEFRQCDTVELVVVFTEIPCLLHQVFAAVVVMEQAGVKTDPVDANRLAPWPVDVLGGDQIISAILECTIDHLDISVDQPESAIRIA